MHKLTDSKYLNIVLLQSFTIIIVKNSSFDILWFFSLIEICPLNQNKFLGL